MPIDPPFEIVSPDTLPPLDELICGRASIPDICSILMPGGAEIAAPNVLERLQPALAPLAPIFSTLEAVVAVKNCIDASVEAISTLDPQPLIECVPGLARAVDKLLALLPQASIPLTTAQTLDCVIVTLGKLRSVLLSLQAQVKRIARVASRAAELDDPKMQFVVACANDRVGDALSDEMKGLVVIGRLLGILSALVDLAGIPFEIPDLEALASAPLDEIIAPLDAAIEALRAARAAIPLP
ncbi:MAG: hypothetical protein KKH12_16055 [Gammaproteobacteria bacterium]|nr:hypothetical protein [Gammaproteobacteria bacterium]